MFLAQFHPILFTKFPTYSQVVSCVLEKKVSSLRLKLKPGAAGLSPNTMHSGTRLAYLPR